MVDAETGAPSVLLVVVDLNTGASILPIQMTTDESRDTAQVLMEAAEAVTLDSHLVMAMREYKYTEPEIASVVASVRMKRQGDYWGSIDQQEATGLS